MEHGIKMALSFQRGEQKGFEYFFNLLYKSLHHFAFRIVNDTAKAEDVVEESFIKIWERHSDFTHGKVIRSWMYTTVKNGALNRLQQLSREEKRNNYIGYNGEFEEPSIEHKIIQAEVYFEVIKYIDDLPVECKRIFNLLYKEGMSPKEASKALNLSISTIKNQKARGVGLILKWLGDGEKKLKPKKCRSKEKSQIQLLRENNSKAWYKLYEVYKLDFEEKLIYSNFSKETKENIIYDAIDLVREGGYIFPTISDYASRVKTLIRQKRDSLEKEKKLKQIVRKDLLVKTPVYAIKPIMPMKGLR
jgi:RNA polymerase sigma factor (sigma-70 family)